MARAIYLIEKIWMDYMENHNHTALGYDVLGYIEGESNAISFCTKGRNYTKKDCWAIWQKEGLPEFRFSKLENLLGEEVVVENHSPVDFRENLDSDSGLESYHGFLGGMFKNEN